MHDFMKRSHTGAKPVGLLLGCAPWGLMATGSIAPCKALLCLFGRSDQRNRIFSGRDGAQYK